MADTRNKIFQALKLAEIPASEDAFREDAEGANGTHAVLRHTGIDSLFASGKVIAKKDEWSLSLYSPFRDVDAENRMQEKLEDAGILIGDASCGFDDEHQIHWCEWNFQTLRKRV